MYNSDTDLLFPMRVIPHLKKLRDEDWRALVEQVMETEADPINQAAFVLMMTRMGGCQTCNTHSFRAMRGCTQCGQQTIRRYRGSDSDLIESYSKAREEVEKHLQKRRTAIKDSV